MWQQLRLRWPLCYRCLLSASRYRLYEARMRARAIARTFRPLLWQLRSNPLRLLPTTPAAYVGKLLHLSDFPMSVRYRPSLLLSQSFTVRIVAPRSKLHTLLYIDSEIMLIRLMPFSASRKANRPQVGTMNQVRFERILASKFSAIRVRQVLHDVRKTYSLHIFEAVFGRLKLDACFIRS